MVLVALPGLVPVGSRNSVPKLVNVSASRLLLLATGGVPRCVVAQGLHTQECGERVSKIGA
jgi:hypothetical protein